ncbi:hypothetical protein [Agrococcus sp. Marseille-Q4369]|uniref:hypothetical protein n=1 Tax=Agrococcus sp. Marseille-Q4369 TaxID=2810513 RepID=UPI00201628B3|nr:hypothetical protein [Agrococcus sp. Marseille-Q4369]
MERGAAAEEHGGGLVVRHARGLAHEALDAHGDELRVRAETRAGHAGDLVPDREGRDALADRRDGARERHPEHGPTRAADADPEPSGEGEAAREASGAYASIARRHRSRGDAHHDLSGASDRVGDLTTRATLGGPYRSTTTARIRFSLHL